MDEFGEDYETEKKVYNILSASPMKGCPSLIESAMDPSRNIYALVLEKLGPSLEDLCNLMTPNVRFDEQMCLALAIQMVRKKKFLVHKLFLLLISDKLDRYADLHARKIIHNGAKPGNICVTARASNTADASTLYLIDFGCSFFCDKTRPKVEEEFSGNKRFWSVLSYHAFSKFFYIFHLSSYFLAFLSKCLHPPAFSLILLSRSCLLVLHRNPSNILLLLLRR